MQTTANTESQAKPAMSKADGAPGLMDDVKSLWTEVRGLTYDHLQLAALETKLAGESLVSMIAAGVIVAVLLVTAWLGLVGAAVLALINSGMLASIAMLLAVALNVVVAFVLYKVIRNKSQNLRWAATLRSLKPRPQTPTGVSPSTDYLNTGTDTPHDYPDPTRHGDAVRTHH